jgi:NADH-quinone oxidoreductase subunit M
MRNNLIGFISDDILILIISIILHILLIYLYNISEFIKNNWGYGCLYILAYVLVLSWAILSTDTVWSLIVQNAPNSFIVIHSNSSIYTLILVIFKINTQYFNVYGYILVNLLILVVIALYYTVAFSKDDILQFSICIVVIYIGGLLLVTSSSILVLFIGYELILIPSIIVIDQYSKTSMGYNASTFMLVWTQLGTIILFSILGLLFYGKPILIDDISSYHLSRSMTNVLTFLIFIAFGAKLPIYPFYWWLPEAHVEVTTGFSIILSGLSIKFAFLGFIRFITWIGTSDIFWILFILVLLGFFDAMFRIDSESDIKKIVAFQTVVEMHSITAFMLLDPITFITLVLYILNVHCWISTINFIIVDIIARRYHTRNIERLYGIFARSPQVTKFIFFLTFIAGAIPGTSVFSLELLLQIQATLNPFGFILFVCSQFLVAVWSKNIWWTLWGGDLMYSDNKMMFNLTKTELILILILLVLTLPPIIIIDIL